MRIQEIRALIDEDLEKELASSYRELMNLRFRHATRQLVNTNELRKTKRTIARIQTIIAQRALIEV
jgi:large subunit ribosomal protein L29